MHRETVAHNQPTPNSEPLPGNPDWHLRKLMAACGVVACAVSLVLSGHLRAVASTHADRMAQARAGSEQIAEQFSEWHEARLAQLDVAEGEGDTASEVVSIIGFGTELPELQLAATGTVNANVADLVAYDFAELEVASIKADERRCLADAIFYESEHESMMGKLGVADVVLNRVKSSYYPDTICGVVYQGSHRKTGCQFSFTCDGSFARRPRNANYEKIDDLAGVILAGMHMPVSRDATHYHADYVNPYWAPSLQPTAQIGVHKFYRVPGKETETIISAAQ